ncbi:hypothetical protein lerEdw1_013713 [Lerista edwardsae]|nr:hypothetical protein lerEdw1_013717 [Lerista edwardsae]KAJ6640462.1 hypothetical protein lerEdw1_013713 [Lerista edwardsae]
MEQASGLLLLLMLTGTFAPSKIFSTETSGFHGFDRLNELATIAEVITMMDGQSFNRMIFCTEEGEEVWCKGELLDECDPEAPPGLLGTGWKQLTDDPIQRVILKNSRNGCISISIPALQVRDSGTYWFGIIYNLKIVPIKKIRLIVHEGQQNNGTVTTTSENEQRVYHVVLVLGSIAVGIIIIAVIVLIVMMLTKRKMRAADDLNFGDNPNCRVITLQICESNNYSLNKEMNTVYTILKRSASKTEDATYVNANFPLRSSTIGHPDDPSGVQSSSGSVDYATIIFGSSIPEIKDNRTLTL